MLMDSESKANHTIFNFALLLQLDDFDDWSDRCHFNKDIYIFLTAYDSIFESFPWIHSSSTANMNQFLQLQNKHSKKKQRSVQLLR